MKRAALFCPGRGSYTATSLGSLDARHPLVQRAEAVRADYELPSLLELDGASKFSAARHLLPANVSPLIYLCSFLDAEEAARERQLVCVGGNSMGWYSALAVAGALSFEDGLRLVQEMSLCQQEHARTHGGGQILYPLVDEEWRPEAERAAAVERALATSNGEARPSIQLGGYAVLAGSEAGIAHLIASLPQITMGKAVYPIRLFQHGPYHTAWQQPVSEQGALRLATLDFHAPRVTLVDGRGCRHTPWSADLAELRSYTLGEQVVAPYDFSASVRVALREFAPEELVLPGPGNSLGGICGQVLLAEGYAGLRSKASVIESGILCSLRR